jgi:hypothetical protein
MYEQFSKKIIESSWLNQPIDPNSNLQNNNFLFVFPIPKSEFGDSFALIGRGRVHGHC